MTDAHRELSVLGWEGSYDALVEVRPVGGSGREARDRLAAVYEGWAAHRQLVAQRLREPRADDEPLLLAVKGLYAFGMLEGEAGLHRFRLGGQGGTSSKIAVAAVRVAAHKPEKAVLTIAVERALKAVGAARRQGALAHRVHAPREHGRPGARAAERRYAGGEPRARRGAGRVLGGGSGSKRPGGEALRRRAAPGTRRTPRLELGAQGRARAGGVRRASQEEGGRHGPGRRPERVSGVSR